MGGNNSVPQKLSDNEIMENINKLFGSQRANNDTTIQTLGIGDCLECEPKRSRFIEFELQLGGELDKTRDKIRAHEFELFMNKIGGTRKDDDFDETLDMDETIDFQNGGKQDDVTSDNFMSELREIGKLSATSVDNINTIPKEQQGGGALSATSPITYEQSQLSTTSNALFGGNDRVDDVTNVMPFYSSTSGTEYYNNMQKEHRYT